MNQAEKRRLENELIVMGLPGLDDPALVQAMADIVNAYPFPAERVEFFCDLLNECEGPRRREMYEAMRPRLAFAVPPLDSCEEKIAAKAEQKLRSWRPEAAHEIAPLEEVFVDLTCHGCARVQEFVGLTTADARAEARNQGWGRGPEPGHAYCPECRLMAMPTVYLSGKVN